MSRIRAFFGILMIAALVLVPSCTQYRIIPMYPPFWDVDGDDDEAGEPVTYTKEGVIVIDDISSDLVIEFEREDGSSLLTHLNEFTYDESITDTEQEAVCVNGNMTFVCTIMILSDEFKASDAYVENGDELTAALNNPDIDMAVLAGNVSVESLTFAKDDFTLLSTSGNNTVTITSNRTDSSGNKIGVYFNAGNSGITIDGFRISYNGSEGSSIDPVYAIKINGSGHVLRNIVVDPGENGSGITLTNASDCVLEDITFIGFPAAAGCGTIQLNASTDIVVDGFTVELTPEEQESIDFIQRLYNYIDISGKNKASTGTFSNIVGINWVKFNCDDSGITFTDMEYGEQSGSYYKLVAID